MSSTTLVGLYLKEDTIDCYEEYQNGHGSAPYVWDMISLRHLGKRMSMWDIDDSFWSLYRDPKLPTHHRAVLMMTYDRAYVKRENYARAAGDIERFMKDFPCPSDRVCHWPKIADAFRYQSESGDPYEAMGLWCTSVSENPFAGEWVEMEYEDHCEEWCTIADGAWELYDDLDQLEPSHSEEKPLYANKLSVSRELLEDLLKIGEHGVTIESAEMDPNLGLVVFNVRSPYDSEHIYFTHERVETPDEPSFTIKSKVRPL